jgi:hypothetical protein
MYDRTQEMFGAAEQQRKIGGRLAAVVAAGLMGMGLGAAGCSSSKPEATPAASTTGMAPTASITFSPKYHIIKEGEAPLYVTDFRRFAKREATDPRRVAMADFIARHEQKWPADLKLKQVYSDRDDESREYYVFMTPKGTEDPVMVFFCNTADRQVLGAYSRVPAK